jgi:hypothetical protein
MRFFKFALLIVLLMLPLGKSIAQQPTIHIDFPTVGSTNISLSPAIKISVGGGFRFDTTYLNQTGYELEMEWDTINNRFYTAQFHLLDTEIYGDGTNDTNVKISKVLGARYYCNFIDNNHLSLSTVRNLRFNRNYGLMIVDLRVINDSTSETIIIDTVITDIFTTTEDVHKVTDISFVGKKIHTNDELTVTFNRKLISDSTDVGSLLQLKKVSGKQDVDTSGFIITFSDVDATTWLSEDSMTVVLLPDSAFDADESYMLQVNLDYLTGDPNNKFSLPVEIKKYSDINVATRLLDTNDVLPSGCKPFIGVNGASIKANEEFEIETYKYYEDFMFIGWDCPTDSTLDGLRDNKITLNYTEDELEDLELTAVYSRIPKDTIAFTNGANGSVTVVASSGLPLLDSVYTLPRDEYSDIVLQAIASDNYKFSHWESTDTTINGRTDPTLVIEGLTYITENQLLSIVEIGKKKYDNPMAFNNVSYLEPVSLSINPVFVYVEDPPASNKSVCIDVVYDWGDETFNNNFDILGIISSLCFVNSNQLTFNHISPEIKDKARACVTVCESLPSCNAVIDFILDGECYQITYWQDNLGVGGGGPNNPLPENTISLHTSHLLTDLNPICAISVHVKKKRIELTVELEEEGQANLHFNVITGEPIVTGASLNKKIKPNPLITKVNIGQSNEYVSNVKFYYSVPCNNTVQIRPTLKKTDQGYKLKEWDCNNGYTCTTVINQDEQILEIENINEITKALFKYEAEFRISKLGFMKQIPIKDDGNFDDDPTPGDPFNYFNSDQKFGDYSGESALRQGTNIFNNLIWQDYEYKTTMIRIEFNKPFDPTTINSSSLWCEDYDPSSLRPDGKLNQKYLPSGNIDYQTNSNYLTFKLVSENNIPICHNYGYKLYITHDITDLDGVHLKNPIDGLYQKTEKPGIKIIMSYFKLNKRNEGCNPDNCSDEVIVHAGAICNTKNTSETGDLKIDLFAKSPGGDYYLMHGGDLVYPNLTILDVQRISEKTRVVIGIFTTEIDRGETKNKWSDISSIASSGLMALEPSGWNVAISIGTAAAAFMADSFWDPDDFLSDVHEDRFNSTSYWGCRDQMYKWVWKDWTEEGQWHCVRMILY